MKRIVSLILTVIMLTSAFACYVSAGKDYIIPNPPINVEFANPTIDGNITDEEGWSSPAYMNNDTLNLYHGPSSAPILGELYFAVDVGGFYFSGDFKVGVLSYDPSVTGKSINVDEMLSGVTEDGKCDFTGDYFELTIDPMRALTELSTIYYYPIPQYTLALCTDGSVYLHDEESMIYNSGETLTEKGALAAGKVTDNGWCFEAWIPWSVIVDDVSKLSKGKLDLNINDIPVHGTEIRAGGKYYDSYSDSRHDVYYTAPEVFVGGLKKPGYEFSNLDLDTLGIELTVSDTCNSGVKHRWSDEIILRESTYLEKGRKMILCNRCGEARYIDVDLRSCEDDFKDIRNNAWYYDGVAYCIQQGYMKGMSDNVFSPNTALTREQCVVMLANFMGVNTDNYKNTESGFKDVPTGKWYSGAVAWAVEQGYLTGVTKDLFGTGMNIQRAAFARLLYSVAEDMSVDMTLRADMTAYTDCKLIPDWAYEQISWAVANNIITSIKDDALVVSSYTQLTRAQAAVMLTKFDRIK
ncbi:MAG: S-layer homology domain-containing protein [Clostridia bacterium]|nr:S-layer homology domain-containing protein [Clostridia bacterium]